MTAASRGNAPAGPKPFPWEAAMAAGLGAMRLSPAAFWAMTPRELAAAMGSGATPAAALARADLAALMRRFPDGADNPKP